jgi:uncharacterized glyoxalase superfamily protein PhnB
MTTHEQSATEAARTSGPTIYPCLGYRDAPAAIRWLCDAFGFEERFVYPGGDDREVAHAELSLGTGIVMLGSASDDMPRVDTVAATGQELDFSRLPFSLYVAVDDVDAHHERAKAAGAEIVREPQDTDYGSREYAARDVEGYVWSFGTYRPAPGG